MFIFIVKYDANDYLILVSGAISATPVSHVGNTQTTVTDEQKNVGLGVMNCRSMDNKSDYIFDHMVDNNLDIVALTEIWLPNDETKCRRVVMDCAANGYTLHHIPRSSGRRGGGVGVLTNKV